VTAFVRYTGLACRIVDYVPMRRSIVVRDRPISFFGFSRGFPLLYAGTPHQSGVPISSSPVR